MTSRRQVVRMAHRVVDPDELTRREEIGTVLIAVATVLVILLAALFLPDQPVRP